VSCNIDIDLKVNIHTAAAVRQLLFIEQNMYTYDPKCTPDRITRIREFINLIDEQIEANLPKDHDHEGV
jgi:molybdate-binding protein